MLRGSQVRVSALCPELVATRIDTAERNRPAHLRSEAGAGPERELVRQAIAAGVAGGPRRPGSRERVLDAIREQRFYVLSEDTWRRSSEVRCEDVRLARNPTLAPPGSN